MTHPDLAGALQELMTAAQQFEAKAAKHTKVEPERFALREAIIRAQLLLSVVERIEHAKRAKDIQQLGYSMLLPTRDDKGKASEDKPKRLKGRRPPKKGKRQVP
jgi:predicted transcriptional regulator of viral defense system